MLATITRINFANLDSAALIAACLEPIIPQVRAKLGRLYPQLP